MEKMIIAVQGEEVEVVADRVFGKCPVCGAGTYVESNDVYADDPYARELCYCGWWANTVMDSRDMDESFEEVLNIAPQMEQPETATDRFSEAFSTLYAGLYCKAFDVDLYEMASDFPLDEKVLKDAFNKTCYDFDVQSKGFDVDIAYESEKVKVTNFNLIALVPEGDTAMGIFDVTLTDVEEF